MNEIYEYRKIRVAPRGWKSAGSWLREDAREALEAAGGSIFGLWRGQIGLGATEGVLLTSWRDEQSPIRADGAFLASAGVVESAAERLVATVRPEHPTPPRGPGVYALRWFDIQARDWPEFLALSERAWPEFEATYGAKILGFWRSLDVSPPRGRVLLLTRYPSLAVWERSRAGARNEHFARRAELTEATVVDTALLVEAGGV